MGIRSIDNIRILRSKLNSIVVPSGAPENLADIRWNSASIQNLEAAGNPLNLKSGYQPSELIQDDVFSEINYFVRRYPSGTYAMVQKFIEDNDVDFKKVIPEYPKAGNVPHETMFQLRDRAKLDGKHFFFSLKEVENKSSTTGNVENILILTAYDSSKKAILDSVGTSITIRKDNSARIYTEVFDVESEVAWRSYEIEDEEKLNLLLNFVKSNEKKTIPPIRPGKRIIKMMYDWIMTERSY